MSGLSTSDYVKLTFVLILSLFCVYTYFDRYFEIFAVTKGSGTKRSLPSTLSIKLDDSICNKFSGDQLVQCQQDFVLAAKNVAEKCDGYYQRLRSCSSGCNIEKNNLDSCVAAVTRKVTVKWADVVPQ
jgi:hypothetical protein